MRCLLNAAQGAIKLAGNLFWQSSEWQAWQAFLLSIHLDGSQLPALNEHTVAHTAR
jgi:hypothetical protein